MIVLVHCTYVCILASSSIVSYNNCGKLVIYTKYAFYQSNRSMYVCMYIYVLLKQLQQRSNTDTLEGNTLFIYLRNLTCKHY